MQTKQEKPTHLLTSRIKSFVVDMFMIMMPIMYITTYVVLGGKDDLNDMVGWIVMAIFGIVIISFWLISGQTPGLRAYDLKLVDVKTNKHISSNKAIIRYFVFLISGWTLILLLLPFFRKDKKTLWDIFSQSIIIKDLSKINQ